MAAMSWNSRMPKLATPAGVPNKLRSDSVARAIAVDDSASPKPATRAACQLSPSAAAARPIARAHPAIWAPP